MTDNSSKPVEVLTAKINVVDILFRLPGECRIGEKHEIHDLVVHGGGPAGNAACVLASLGWDVGFLAHIGNDTRSRVARAEMARCALREDFLIETPGA